MYIIKPINKVNFDQLNDFTKSKISNLDHKIIISKKFTKNNLSFVLFKDNKIKGLCPISYEKHNSKLIKYKAGTFFGISLPGMIISDQLSTKELRDIISTILKEIDKLCKKNSINSIKICFSDFINFDLNSLKSQILNRLLVEFRYLDVSMVGNRINLKKDYEILFNSISKGHKAILKNSKYSIHYYNNSKHKLNYDNFFKIIDQVKENKEYIKYLYEVYKENCLEIVDVYDNKQKIAFAVFSKINKSIEYFSSKSISQNKSAHHFLILDAMKKYQKEGFDFLNLGVISYGPQLHYIPSKKHLNISVFKRGFKGENYNLTIYEKYFSKKLFNKIQSSRTKNFLKTINE